MFTESTFINETTILLKKARPFKPGKKHIKTYLTKPVAFAARPFAAAIK